MRAGISALVLGAGLAGAAWAYDDFPARFGELVGTAEACGLALDPARVTAVVVERVGGDDMRFTHVFTAYVWSGRREVQKLSEVERAVVCMQTERAAAALGVLR